MVDQLSHEAETLDAEVFRFKLPQPRTGGSLRVGLHRGFTFDETRALDLLFTVDLQIPEVSAALYSTLLRFEDGMLVPNLAESWDADPGARMIHEKTRRAEFEAFSAWIQACCQDETLTSVTTPSVAKTVGPEKPLEVVRHGRKSRLVESFTRNIWSQRMRCFPCHTPHEIDPENPNHQVPAQRHREFVEKYGAKMNLFAETPEATLTQLVAGSRHRVALPGLMARTKALQKAPSSWSETRSASSPESLRKARASSAL